MLHVSDPRTGTSGSCGIAVSLGDVEKIGGRAMMSSAGVFQLESVSLTPSYAFWKHKVTVGSFQLPAAPTRSFYFKTRREKWGSF